MCIRDSTWIEHTQENDDMSLTFLIKEGQLVKNHLLRIQI